MCNLYTATSSDDVRRYFEASVDSLVGVKIHNPVTPFAIGYFLKPGPAGRLQAIPGQWGMIRPGSPTRREKVNGTNRWRSTNNGRAETIASLATFRQAWRAGHRCLIPADAYQEPNWDTLKHIPWQLRRRDGDPWAIAGLYSEWTDPETGEVVPNYVMITVNCNDHPMLRRLHRPDVDPATKVPLPMAKQDKRSTVHIPPPAWKAWLHGSADDARQLLVPAPVAMFDLSDVRTTDEAMTRLGLPLPEGSDTATLAGM